jgi:hypothetical protein
MTAEENRAGVNPLIAQHDGGKDYQGAKISRTAMISLGTILFALVIVSGYMIIALWPEAQPPQSADVKLFWWKGELDPERRLLMLVLLCGALGSLVHAATSFSNYVGDNKLDQKWVWWYILRPVIGMAIAFIFYIVFRAGLVVSEGVEHLNIYGVLTLAALSGLFTDKATLKLTEVFETIFKVRDTRKDKISDASESDFNDANAKS